MINFRKAIHQDINQIVKLENENMEEILVACKQDLDPLPNYNDDSYLIHVLEGDVGCCFLAEYEFEGNYLIIGTIIALNEDRMNYPYNTKKRLEITSIFVAKEFRSQGIGKKLLSLVEDWATERQYFAIYLDVYDENLNAKNLYEQMEYEPLKINYRKVLEKDKNLTTASSG